MPVARVASQDRQVVAVRARAGAAPVAQGRGARSRRVARRVKGRARPTVAREASIRRLVGLVRQTLVRAEPGGRAAALRTPARQPWRGAETISVFPRASIV